jgi:hypothetical protein
VSLSARSIVLIAALLPAAGATTITILPAANMAQASADITSWLILNFGPGTTGKPVHVDIDPIGGNGETKKLALLTSLHSLYFLMSGFEDNMQIQTADGTKAYVHDGDEGLYFVGITSSTPIASIQWSSHGSFVLSNFGSPEGPAAAPELATWLSVATGLIAIKRRYRVPSAPSRAAPWIWR